MSYDDFEQMIMDSQKRFEDKFVWIKARQILLVLVADGSKRVVNSIMVQFYFLLTYHLFIYYNNGINTKLN